MQQNTWYDVATAGPYTSTISGYSVTWNNVIQARWTSLSGTVYSVQYRCLIRKISGDSYDNTSSYNGYSIGGSGATTSSATNVTLNYPTIGDNVVATVSGTYDAVNSTTITVTGGVQLGYYGSTWGGTNLSGTINLPSVGPAKPTVSATPTSTTSISVTYGTTSFGSVGSGTVYLYGGTSSSPTTEIDSKTTTGDSTISLTGLTEGTSYYYRARAYDGTHYSSYSDEVEVKTPVEVKHNEFYGSVSNAATSAQKFYGR